MNFRRFPIAVLVALALLFAAHSTASATPPPPDINPANFVRRVTNKYFPLTPGTTYYYAGHKDGVPTTDEIAVTNQTKTILGVRCTVVHHRSFENGVLVEDTFDWFAQDTSGSVWYFGEDTKELDPAGNVISTLGSWEAGVDGAMAGIMMEANPRVGDRYYQEFYRDVAEDQAQVLGLAEAACTQFRCFSSALLTKEWSRLSPGDMENKYYAAGIGFVRGDMIKGGNEHSELVRITKPVQTTLRRGVSPLSRRALRTR